jgi:hypothetical protein
MTASLASMSVATLLGSIKVKEATLCLTAIVAESHLVSDALFEIRDDVTPLYVLVQKST